jgi:hypothetical protein
MSISGMPVIAIGRVGKVMAFIGGVVAVIDIIGPDNIRAWAERRRDNYDMGITASLDRWVAGRSGSRLFGPALCLLLAVLVPLLPGLSFGGVLSS